LSWHCFPPFDSSPNGEPLIAERIRQVADFPPLEAGGWKLTALFSLKPCLGTALCRSIPHRTVSRRSPKESAKSLIFLRWRLEAGGWKLAAGSWRLEADCSI
jgi:hypothetical protein